MTRVWLAIAMGVLIGPAIFSAEVDKATVGRRWEGRFEAKQDVPHADHLNVELTVTLTSPKGKVHRVVGFWDGDRTWRVRFRPMEAGLWQASTQSSPSISGLDQVKLSFECAVAKPRHALDQHGPIQVAKSRRTHLEHADGTPFFWLGDTVWNGPLLSTEGDWKKYLDDRLGKKFTVVQFNMLAPWRTAATDEAGQPAFSGKDTMHLNPKFFQRLDRRFTALDEAGLLAAPVLVWSLTKNDPGQLLKEADIIKLVRYQLARYGAEQVVWILAGDNPYKGESAERWKRIGKQVFGKETHAPVSTHPTGMNWPWESWRDEAWLDILGYQSGHGNDNRALDWLHSGPVRDAGYKSPPKPIINLEPPYEDHLAYQSKLPHSAHSIRRAIYWSLLVTPPAGVTYGGHGMWSWQTAAGVPKDHANSGTAQPWHIAKDLPGAGQMKHLADLFTSLPWWQLRPAQTLLTEQPGSSSPAQFIAAAQAERNELALLYLPVGGKVTLKQAPDKLGYSRAEWFNPCTGQRTPIKSITQSTLNAPDDKDWLLLLKK